MNQNNILIGFIPGQKTKKKQYTILTIKTAGMILPFKVNGSIREAIEKGIIKQKIKV